MMRFRAYFRVTVCMILVFGSAAFFNVWLLIFFPVRKQLGPLLIQGLSKTFLRVANVRVRRVPRRGDVPGRRRPTLIVANHLSFLDIIVLSAVFGSVFVSKQEVRSWPILGAFGWLSGIRFLDRSRMARRMSLVKKLAVDLAPGTVIAVFPQGTTSASIEDLPFLKGIFKVVELNPRIRLLPVTLQYENEANVAWAGENFLDHALRVLSVQATRVRVFAHPQVTIAAYAEKGTRGVARSVERTVKAPLAARSFSTHRPN